MVQIPSKLIRYIEKIIGEHKTSELVKIAYRSQDKRLVSILTGLVHVYAESLKIRKEMEKFRKGSRDYVRLMIKRNALIEEAQGFNEAIDSLLAQEGLIEKGHFVVDFYE
jgi:hypothetical protein